MQNPAPPPTPRPHSGVAPGDGGGAPGSVFHAPRRGGRRGRFAPRTTGSSAGTNGSAEPNCPASVQVRLSSGPPDSMGVCRLCCRGATNLFRANSHRLPVQGTPALGANRFRVQQHSPRRHRLRPATLTPVLLRGLPGQVLHLFTQDRRLDHAAVRAVGEDPPNDFPQPRHAQSHRD